jgi:anaerobic magnesium-protoporphyrin IX monomethyl ester cyclase
MRVALIGAELEENLGLRYMASALEAQGHQAEIVPFNSEQDLPSAVRRVAAFDPQIAGLSMIFTNRAREFCKLAGALRGAGYRGHVIAGGPFASFNCEQLLRDFPAFDSVGLGEGEGLLCAMAADLAGFSSLPGLCYRLPDGSIGINPSTGNPDNLDSLPFPKRTTFHTYFDKPIASLLTSRGCWRDCAFCSINAWYLRAGGKKFRVRGVGNVVAEMAELYHRHGIRIFNIQDDNFFLPNPDRALERFQALRAGLRQTGVEKIAIAVKARPDSINYELIRVLDDLGLFRVFLGVENAAESGLRNLNRKNTVEQILNALRILNDFDVHLAYNLLMFEPDTTMDDLLTNLRFMERHIENPFNFCRAEAYPGTGLEYKLRPEGRLLGDYFGFDYRLKDARCEAFHQIANYAFFDRNFSDFGLHYFNMQVDFYFQLLRRFHPEVLNQTLRAAVRVFIKQTNLDTYECLCRIYDFVSAADPTDQLWIRAFAREMREHVDERSQTLHLQGERLLRRLEQAYENRGQQAAAGKPEFAGAGLPPLGCHAVPYRGIDNLRGIDLLARQEAPAAGPIPYSLFKAQLIRETPECSST